jgi:HD superfamily phosphohydrolase
MQKELDACSALLSPNRTVSIWPGHSYALSVAEDAVLATAPMQRLRRLRQMGLAYHAHPNCEHTRFSHSVGTCYWAVRMLEALKQSDEMSVDSSAPLLRRMGAQLPEGICLELLVRLFALIHDVALLPLDHTLRFQVGWVHPENFRDRMRTCLRAIDSDLRFQSFAPIGNHEHLIDAMTRHLVLVEAISHVSSLLAGKSFQSFLRTHDNAIDQRFVVHSIPVLTFVYDVVHGVYSADLIDICIRDMHAAGIQWEMPESVIEAGSAVIAKSETPAYPLETTGICREVFRYGIDCRSSQTGDVSTLHHLAFVHRTRREIAVKGFYADRKCFADAMLDKAIRLLLEHTPEALIKPEFTASSLLKTGDDEFLDLLETTIDAHESGATINLIREIRQGRLYEPVLSIDSQDDTNAIKAVSGLLETTTGRNEFEAEVAGALEISPTDVIVNLLPAGMQGKAPTTLVRTDGHDWQPLSTLSAENGSVADMHLLHRSYETFRKLTFMIAPNLRHQKDTVKSVCLSQLERVAQGWSIHA